VEAKTHRIGVEKRDYQSQEKQVEIRTGKTSTLAFVLRPLAASLTVEGAAAGTDVYVDGSPKGKAGDDGKLPHTIEVQVGRHTIGLALEGYQRKDLGVVEFGPNQHITLTAEQVKLVAAVKGRVVPDADAATGEQWSRLENGDDLAALEDFRNKHQGTPWGDKAGGRINQIDDRDWQAALQASSVQALDGYSNRHRQGNHASEVPNQKAALEYAGVNKGDPRALRDFAGRHPNTDIGKQALQQAQSIDQDLAAKSQIRATLSSFNSAMKQGKPKELTQIWPNATEKYLRPPAHTTYSLEPIAEPVVEGDHARVSCSHSTIITQPYSAGHRTVTVDLQYRDGKWVIAKIS
jgi:hypothetical protein